MRAFISYSLNDQDQYLITLLATELRQRGFSLSQSTSFRSNLDRLSMNYIAHSQIFIGIVTIDGYHRESVLNEWNYANELKVPTLLLVEKGIPIANNFEHSFIRFDRYNPETAIQELKRRMENKEAIKTKSSDGWTWVLGGAALLAVLGLLSNRD